MLNEVVFNTIADLYDYIEEYKSTKPNNSANSLGIIFEEDGHVYWYDSGTSKVVEVDQDIAFLFYNLANSNLLLDDVMDIVSSRNIDKSALIAAVNSEDLLKGFQINSLHCSEFFKHLHKQIQSGTSQLILELTEQCNMRCKYCIYHEGYSDTRSFGVTSMPKSTALKSIDYMVEYGDPEEVYITFYGGEPLLEFELLKDVIEYCKQKLSNRKLTFSFTSNLTLLTPEMIDYFSTVDNLNIMCSLDGPKDINDLYRVYADQSGSFDDTIRNLELLCNACKNNDGFNVSANGVYAPPYSEEKVKIIDDFFSNLEFVPDNFTYQLGYPSPDTLPEELIDETYAGDLSLQNWQNEMFSQMKSFNEFKESSIISEYDRIHKRLITPRTSNNVPLNGCCIAGYRRLYVKTNGDFTPCERVGYCPTIGNVFTGINLDAIYSKYIFEYSDKWTEHCNDCWSAKLCSRCYVERMDENGVKIPVLETCDYERSSNIRSLQKYHHVLLTNPEKLDFLNSMETI